MKYKNVKYIFYLKCIFFHMLAKLIFQQPVFSVTWFFTNHSNADLLLKKQYYKCWKRLCCLTFLRKLWYLLGFFDKYTQIKRTAFVTFDKFNASSLNKSMNFFKNFWMTVYILHVVAVPQAHSWLVHVSEALEVMCSFNTFSVNSCLWSIQ